MKDSQYNGRELSLAGIKILSDNKVSAFINEVEYFAELQDSQPGKLIWRFEELALEWHWNYKIKDKRLIIENQLINQSNKNLQLGKFFLVNAIADCFDKSKDLVYTNTSFGDNNWKYPSPEIQRSSNKEAVKESIVKMTFFDEEKSSALQAAFLSFQRVLTFVKFTINENNEVTRLYAGMDFASWTLEAKSSTAGETFSLAISSDPFAILEDWASLAAEIIKPVFRKKPALGLAGGAWGLGEYNNTEQFKIAIAQKSAERLAGFGFEFVWISIANLPGGNPGAWQDWNYNNLPSGIEYTVKELEKNSLKLGFWFSPFMLSSHLTELVEEFDEAILRGPDGEKINYYPIWSHGDAGLLPVEERPFCYALDPSHPKTQIFVRESLEKYRAAGVRYYMMDFLGAGAGEIQRHKYKEHYDKKLVAGPEVFSAGMKVVREAVGEDCFLLSSTGPKSHVSGFVDAVRVGNDFGEGRRIMPNSGFYPASFVINGSFTSAATALKCAAVQYYTHNKLYQNDSGNVLTVDLPLPLETARIHASIHSFSGSSTMLGDNLCDITDERLSLIKKTLPRDTNIAKPLDLFSSAPETPRFYYRKIETPWQKYTVLAIYNLSGEARSETVMLKDVVLQEADSYQVWEFWDENYIGTVKDKLQVEIPAESVRVYRICATENRPMLIATNMHTHMGLMEVEGCEWNEKESSLTVKARRPKGEKGALFFHMPEGWHVINQGEFHIARNRDGAKGEVVIYAPCNFETEVVEKKLLFGRHGDKADDSRM